MLKRMALTAAGIVLSFAIAIGGWVVTSRLIDMESDRLLTATTSFSVDTPALLHMDEENYDNPYDRPSLTEHEIARILRNWEQPFLISSRWESTTHRRLHEPAPGQIDMQEAIMVAREGVRFLADHGILPAEVLTFNDTRAYLGQYVPQGEPFLPIAYSFWNVRFFNDYMELLMTINAMTGQIWRIDTDVRAALFTDFFEFERLPIYITEEKTMVVLTAFMANLDIGFDDSLVSGMFSLADNRLGRYRQEPSLYPPVLPLYIYQGNFEMVADAASQRVFTLYRHSFADGEAAAIVTATGIMTGHDTVHFSRLSIFLTTH